jgi:hypothetical protein
MTTSFEYAVRKAFDRLDRGDHKGAKAYVRLGMLLVAAGEGGRQKYLAPGWDELPEVFRGMLTASLLNPRSVVEAVAKEMNGKPAGAREES